jgi:vacuolar-type H+-ATPase subunit E/Vma4
MALNGLKQFLEQEAEAAIRILRAETDKAVAAELAPAQRAAAAILEDGERHGAARRSRAKAVAMDQARVRKIEITHRVREEMIQAAFDEAKRLLADRIHQPPCRRAMIRRLLFEALGLVGDHPTAIEVAPGDAETVNEACRNLKIDADVRENERIGTGVQVISTNIVVDNSIDSRFRKARVKLIGSVAAILFKSA